MANNQNQSLAAGVPIVDVAAALGLEVVGGKCHCFNSAGHQNGRDDHPSLKLFNDSNRFKCFACGSHGDVIDLVRGYRSCGFREALEWVHNYTGGALPLNTNWSAHSPVTPNRRHPDKSAVEVYQSLFDLTREIKKGSPESGYLWSRRLKRRLAAQLGVRRIADSDVVWSRLQKRYDDEDLDGAGLVSKKGRFLFRRHTLLFFYFDGNRPVYVQARDITGDANAKELSPAGLTSPIPFNRNLLRPGLKEVYVCEGCIDTVSAVQLEFPAVGVPGTSGFQPDWFQLFEGVEQIHLLFDNDVAGQRAGERLRTEFLLRGFRADAFHPAFGNDVNDMLRVLSLKKES